MAKKTSLRYAIFLAFLLALFVAMPAALAAPQGSGSADEAFLEADKTLNYDPFIQQYKPGELAFVAVQRLTIPFLRNRDWQGAVAVYKKYQADFPDMAERFAAIIALLEAPKEGLKIRNLGGGINTAQGEFRPVVTADGQKLYFGRNCGECDGGEDIFVSLRDGQDWELATELGYPISTKSHEMPTGISSDGLTLLLFGNYPGSLGRGDIFYAEKTGDCWGTVNQYPPPINTAYFDSDAAMSADGKAILFVSERPDGIGDFHRKGDFFHGSYGGNTDIYVYVQTGDHAGEVINLGATINTPYSEHSPFLHPDGKTLYFSSDGHAGLGGLDVYKSTRLSEDSWTQWSTPVNLGKEVNGPFNDWGYQFSTAGDLAYFSASGKVGGYGGNDIYSIAMPAAAKPAAVVTVTGKVTDPDAKPLAAAIRWNDLTQMKPAGENNSDAQTGEYFIALPAGREYSYNAEKDGYIGSSAHLDLREAKEHSKHRLDIVLYPVKKLATGAVTLRFNNIFFDFDKYDLRPASALELDRWVEFLKKNEQLTAEIQGHTDSTGTDAYNRTLSERRAQAVANYLTEHGISTERIHATGFGESKPVAPNDTAENRQLNRRVVVHFGEKGRGN